MKLIIKYSDIDSRFYVYLYFNNYEIAEIGNTTKKPNKQKLNEMFWDFI